MIHGVMGGFQAKLPGVRGDMAVGFTTGCEKMSVYTTESKDSTHKLGGSMRI